MMASRDLPARIQLIVDPRRVWRWHLWLVEELQLRLGADVSVALRTDGQPLPASVRLLLSLERIIYRSGADRASDAIDISELFAAAGGDAAGTPADLAIDLSGQDREAAPGMTVLRPRFDGSVDETTLIAAVIDGRIPRIDLSRDGAQAGWTAWPAAEDGKVLSRALDNLFSSMLRLIVKAVTTTQPADAPGSEATRAPQQRQGVLGFAAATLTAKAAARIDRLCRRAPRWFVGWRWTDGDPIGLTGALPATGYRRLPDDSGRYYADPFVIEVEGRHHLFCEEYDHALGRGVISTTLLERGRDPAPPHVALERSYHLSYPMVFSHAGEIWMVPETSQARRIELYRARHFPDDWEYTASLIDGIEAGDTTIFRHEGRWWMLVSTREWQSSSWDSLSAFHAPDLFGPWTPHGANPLLIDRTSARPGGHVFMRDGALWRPAQDCSGGYGSGISLCSIDRLDPERFSQTMRSRIMPGPGWPGLAMHTLNFTNGLETVDGFA